MAEKPKSPHLFADVLARVHAVCGALAAEDGWPAGIDFSRVVVEPLRAAATDFRASSAIRSTANWPHFRHSVASR